MSFWVGIPPPMCSDQAPIVIFRVPSWCVGDPGGAEGCSPPPGLSEESWALGVWECIASDDTNGLVSQDSDPFGLSCCGREDTKSNKVLCSRQSTRPGLSFGG